MARISEEDKSQEMKALEKELKKLGRIANKKLLILEREFGKENMFASKLLKSRLDTDKIKGWTRGGRVRTSISDKNITQVKAEIKAIKEFNESKTSTPEGIKEVKAKIIAGMKKSAQKIQGKKRISMRHVNTFYEMIESKSWIFQYIPESEFWNMVNEAKSEKRSPEWWVESIGEYIHYGNDRDLMKKVLELYRDLISWISVKKYLDKLMPEYKPFYVVDKDGEIVAGPYEKREDAEKFKNYIENEKGETYHIVEG